MACFFLGLFFFPVLVEFCCLALHFHPRAEYYYSELSKHGCVSVATEECVPFWQVFKNIFEYLYGELTL